MYVSHATDRTATPYNTAYLRDDRTHLYAVYEIDPAADGGSPCPETDEMGVPHDLRERRKAILSFYGHRCGRCLTSIALTENGSTDEASLGYLYSIVEATDLAGESHPEHGDRWALENLVPVCEPCYEVCSITDPDRLDTFDSAYRESQQFPQWLGDPRVAVERVPLSGRDLWIREQLAARYVDRPDVASKSVNDTVARSACLARKTPAATAIAFGERLAADAWQPMPTEQRLTEQWETLSEDERSSYERRTADPQTLVEDQIVSPDQ